MVREYFAGPFHASFSSALLSGWIFGVNFVCEYLESVLQECNSQMPSDCTLRSRLGKRQLKHSLGAQKIVAGGEFSALGSTCPVLRGCSQLYVSNYYHAGVQLSVARTSSF